MVQGKEKRRTRTKSRGVRRKKRRWAEEKGRKLETRPSP